LTDATSTTALRRIPSGLEFTFRLIEVLVHAVVAGMIAARSAACP